MKSIVNRVIITAVAASALAGHASGTDRPFDYLQFSYVVGGDIEFGLGGGASAELDIERGYVIKGAFALNDMFYVAGESHNLDYDDSTAELLSAGDSVVINDLALIGAGLHFPVTADVELYGQLGLARATVAQFSGSGFGVKAGGRIAAGMADVDVWYLFAATDVTASGDKTDIEPSLFGLDVALELAEGAPQLVLGYAAGTTELSSGTDAVDLDSNAFSVGIRKQF